MNILKRIFGSGPFNDKKPQIVAVSRTVEQIQADTDKLWTLLRETVNYYNNLACPCAFPRFIQYTSIDCVEMDGAFYMSETEGFIQFSQECFNINKTDKEGECYRALCTCKKCGSTFRMAWSDFSIRVNRTYLKPVEILAKQVGANSETPIPFFVGLFGHSYSDKSGFKQVDFDTFKNYIQAIR